ncbi:uncharacterized protein VP01_12381g1, partial [Puccinia sorghi]
FMLWYILMISLSIKKNLTIILYAKLLKCNFNISSLQFLGVIVASNSRFLGFANFYQKFIKNYSKTIVNLTSLLSFSFTTAPILANFSELAQTLIKKDASDYAVAGVISQYSSLNLLHPEPLNLE